MTVPNPYWEGDCAICGTPIPRTDPEDSPCPNRYFSPHDMRMRTLVMRALKHLGVRNEPGDQWTVVPADVHQKAIEMARAEYSGETRMEAME